MSEVEIARRKFWWLAVGGVWALLYVVLKASDSVHGISYLIFFLGFALLAFGLRRKEGASSLASLMLLVAAMFSLIDAIDGGRFGVRLMVFWVVVAVAGSLAWYQFERDFHRRYGPVKEGEKEREGP